VAVVAFGEASEASAVGLVHALGPVLIQENMKGSVFNSLKVYTLTF